MKTCIKCNEEKAAEQYRAGRGTCRDCERRGNRERYATWTPERRAEHSRKIVEWQRTPAGVEKQRRSRLKHRYDLTVDEYDAMLVSQGGKCLICQVEKPRGFERFSVDHCHQTGEVRGLLCVRCNSTLGWVETMGIERIRAYLTGELR